MNIKIILMKIFFREYNFYVYILGSISGTLYIGMTNNLFRRMSEHKNKLVEGFSKKYGCDKLLYYEYFEYVENAITREKQLKNWNRKKKEFLIKTQNPHWEDLFSNLLKE